jgi:hypothetical protein
MILSSTGSVLSPPHFSCALKRFHLQHLSLTYAVCMFTLQSINMFALRWLFSLKYWLISFRNWQIRVRLFSIEKRLDSQWLHTRSDYILAVTTYSQWLYTRSDYILAVTTYSQWLHTRSDYTSVFSTLLSAETRKEPCFYGYGFCSWKH